ncbi:MAG: hypothetical protein M3525_01690, partial [Acidobacteriota bacterium]|nr:hypothetical protein [Acidobacteriota bacterium]
DLWVAGRGGTMLRRSETLSTIKVSSSSKAPPTLRPGVTKTKPRPRVPLLTVPDDGDIEVAAPPKKDN